MGLIALMVNVNSIPVGNELGAIAQFMMAAVFAIGIYGATIVLSVWVPTLKSEYELLIQTGIHSLSVIAIYISSWYICVYS